MVYKKIDGEWVKQNAYKMTNGEWVQISEADSGQITDLTGTTWYVPSGWSITNDFGTYNVKGSISFNSSTSGLVEDSFIQLKCYEAFSNLYLNYTISSSRGNSIGSDKAFTISFTGGTDVTNPDLIEWLETYGTMQ